MANIYESTYRRWLFDECSQLKIIWKCPCGQIGDTDTLRSHFGHSAVPEHEESE